MKKTMLKRLIAIVMILALVMGLAACGNSGKKKGDLTLTFQQWFAEESPEGLIQEICDGFTEQTGIKIELLNAPNNETKPLLLSGAANGTIADIVGCDGKWISDLVAGGAVTPLDDLFKKCDVDTSVFSDTWVYEGKTYGMPMVVFNYPMAVNTDILDEVGIDPESIKTRSDFLAACKAVTDAGYLAYGWNATTSNPVGLDHVFLNSFWASGGNLRDDSGKFVLENNDDFKETAEFFKELVDSGYIAPGYMTSIEADIVSKFGSGDLAFCNPSLSMLTIWDTNNPNLHYTVIPMPLKDGYTGTVYADYACWGIGISDHCEHKEEAMEFIKYMFTAEANGKLAEGKGCFPASTVSNPDYPRQGENFQKSFSFWKSSTPRAQFNAAKEASTLRTGILENILKYIEGDFDVDTMAKECQKICDEVYK